MRRGIGLIALAALATASPSSARPTFWERVKAPRAVHVHQVWLGAERALDAVEPEYWSRDIEKRTHEDCAEKIQLWGGVDSLDPSLLFLFGRCLVASERGYDERGRDTLLLAIELYPDSPRVARAWASIGIAAKRLGDRELERRAYTRALAVEWEPSARAELFLRRGQTAMSSGDLRSAVIDFRIALEESQHPEPRALARWALAVALDRSYDLPSALPHARAAEAFRFGPAGTLNALDADWFELEPAYEVHYYRALAHLAEASVVTDEVDLVGALEAAQALFISYTKAAHPNDPWAARAQQHIQATRRRIAELLATEYDAPVP